jgi:hypothetical protein
MRGLSREERIREMQRGALRHYGRKYAFWIVFGPAIAKAALWLGLAVLAYVTWRMVPHALLGGIALAIAAAALGALAWPHRHLFNLRRRMVTRAVPAGPSGIALGWAYATLLVVGLGMGWLALWSPFS